MEETKRLIDYHISERTELQFCPRMLGSGKRGRPIASVDDKEQKLSEITMQLAMITTLLQQPSMSFIGHTQITHNIGNLVTESRGNPDTVVQMMLQALPLCKLMRLQESLTSSNNESVRIQSLSKVVWEADMANIANQQAAMGKAVEAMNLSVRMALISSYFDKGFDWVQYGKHLQQLIMDKAKEEDDPVAGFGSLSM